MARASCTPAPVPVRRDLPKAVHPRHYGPQRVDSGEPACHGVERVSCADARLNPVATQTQQRREPGPRVT